MKLFRNCALLILTVLFLSSCADKPATGPEVLTGAYWKNQALNDIIPYWSKYSHDTVYGAFITNLDSVWKPFGKSDKYPSMISRQIFSYSVSYLLSGNKNDLERAEKAVQWLNDKAWDKEFGGWFDVLDAAGNTVDSAKTTFVQVYAITGLALYYFVTHDPQVLACIEQANNLLESKVWDQGAGGYYNVMNRDWSIKDSNKSFSSQITPVSGYLIYLYCTTHDPKYLSQIDRILNVTTTNMIDKESGWVLENFDKNWVSLSGKEDKTEINIGHNIETAWMLLRANALTGDSKYLNIAEKLSQTIFKYGVLKDKELWLTTVDRNSSSVHHPNTYWWVQAYGNMFNLYWYHATGQKKYLDDFQKGAILWDKHFMDKKHGDTYTSIDTAGMVKDATKANRFKTSYHSMEHCLLNYLCLNLWTNKEPVEFHFKINSSKKGKVLYPVLLEDKNIKISKVIIDNEEQNSLVKEDQSVQLPERNKYDLKVILYTK